ncbi:MAG TPA: porin [Rhodospirillaceae bacterium]|nr:porin [Rhodospirillaceae bacterium]
MNKKSSSFLLTPLLILLHPFMAQAEDKPIQFDISGHIKMYGNYIHQDGDVKKVDILRDTDVTFSGETVLSNGLTVGALVNADGDGDDGFAVEDSFIFASGAWGRVSYGMEDGAVFLLQVAAPSADDNIDGLEPFISPINYAATSLAGTHFENSVAAAPLGYANFLTAGIDKMTYMTPVLSGVQAAISYTPDVQNFTPVSRGINGNNPDHQLDQYGSAWETGLRYEHSISDSFSYSAGAGYTNVAVEQRNAASTIDTFKQWNIGLDFDIGAYGIGAVYTADNGGANEDNDRKTFAIGTDYTIGQTKYGASWLHTTHEESSTEKIKANRLTGGFVHEYGPGLSFRGAVSRVSVDVPSTLGGDVDGTSVTIGTQILF